MACSSPLRRVGHLQEQNIQSQTRIDVLLHLLRSIPYGAQREENLVAREALRLIDYRLFAVNVRQRMDIPAFREQQIPPPALPEIEHV